MTTQPKISKTSDKNLKSMTIITRIILGIIGVIILIISRYAFTFFFLAIIPSVTAIIIDRRSLKYASSTICAFNIIGAMPYLFELWFATDIDVTAKQFITSTHIWFSIYGTTTIGWLIIWNLPQICGKIFQTRALMRINKLKTEQNLITEEWGSDVKGKL